MSHQDSRQYCQSFDAYYRIINRIIENDHDWQQLDTYFYPLAALEDKNFAACICQADLAAYQESLAISYKMAMQRIQAGDYSALYIEFNPENLWASLLCVCKYYVPKNRIDEEFHTEDWACEFLEDESVDGPNFEEFSNIYNASIGKLPGIQAYLIARCFACLGKIYARMPNAEMALCVAIHDAEIIRIQEFLPPIHKLYGSTKRTPLQMAEEVLTQEEMYIFNHYHNLVRLFDELPNRKEKIKKVLLLYRESLIFNYCPFCGELRRTPNAKQCQYCFKRE